VAFIYITCKGNKEAKNISRKLLEKKLVACASTFPIESSYWWKGKIENSREYAILAKTKKWVFREIEKEVKKWHSYEIPCISMINSTDIKDYSRWAEGEIKNVRK